MKMLGIGDRRLEKAPDDKAPARVSSGWAILKQEKIRNLPKRDLFKIVLASVAKAFADTNTKEISNEDRNYLVNELTDNILKYHPAIRLNEIPEAIAQGVRGRYGEFYGLSVVTFLKFIEQYLFSEKRTSLVKELPPDEVPKPVPSLQTQFETAKLNAMHALQRKKDKKDISAVSTSVYNFLDQLTLLQSTPNEKYDMMADATRELIDELKYKLIVSPYVERAAIKKDIEAYTDALTEHTEVNDRQLTFVKMRAKKLALDAFLNNVILEGGDLGRLIEEKREVFLKE
ncbi:hypothetical protein [Mucilaginibacter sp. OK098]|uniref:hypothetical protein n=1 Tax=Mucilaginibacter sp. OK098 TaxID=1855297 RepID=UPI00091F01FC|nr:hypothetical protein [Mucilaginibacter sp. OK098]SHM51075.1 hypothetical protein SAMN05216524_102343 [Mucilaginibacter sp. OK098]